MWVVVLSQSAAIGGVWQHGVIGMYGLWPLNCGAYLCPPKGITSRDYIYIYIYSSLKNADNSAVN